MVCAMQRRWSSDISSDVTHLPALYRLSHTAAQHAVKNSPNLGNSMQKIWLPIIGLFLNRRSFLNLLENVIASRSLAKQSPIKRANLVEKCLPPNWRLLRRGGHAPRKDIIKREIAVIRVICLFGNNSIIYFKTRRPGRDSNPQPTA